MFLLSLLLSTVTLAMTPIKLDLGHLASPALVEVLANGKVSNVTVEGYDKAKPVNSAECTARIIRPDPEDEGDSVDPSNEVRCEFRQGEKSGVVLLKFDKTPIQRFGSRFEKLAFMFTGPLSDQFYEAIRIATKAHPGHPAFATMDESFITGDQIQSYGILSTPHVDHPDRPRDHGALAIDCNRFHYEGKLWKAFCSFL